MSKKNEMIDFIDWIFDNKYKKNVDGVWMWFNVIIAEDTHELYEFYLKKKSNEENT